MTNTFAKIRKFFIIPLICLGFFSCIPEESFPPETILEFQRVQFWVDAVNRDSLVGISLLIRFQDGNGNIGNIAPDTTHNLFVHVFDRISLTDTIYVPMQTIHPTSPENWVKSFAVPNLGSGSVSGTFDVGFFDDFPLLQRAELGIVRFEIYMFDRDSVQSNRVITPDIHIR
ncbi:MAG: hypothetical protein FWC98_01055 [Bacteroidales bacterium]|nr:hypothetical protein [Bacteroidales bacterium]